MSQPLDSLSELLNSLRQPLRGLSQYEPASYQPESASEQPELAFEQPNPASEQLKPARGERVDGCMNGQMSVQAEFPPCGLQDIVPYWERFPKRQARYGMVLRIHLRIHDCVFLTQNRLFCKGRHNEEADRVSLPSLLSVENVHCGLENPVMRKIILR